MTAAKRALDLAGATIGLVLLWPLLLLVAAAIKLQDGGPVFFRQLRMGQRGSFRIWKFRTMRPVEGSRLTIGADPRITPVGHWLRLAKLDELPQLLNVLVGNMSLVGPRPEVPEFADVYVGEFRQLLDCRPGMTDPASLAYRDEAAQLATVPDPHRTYRERILPEKLRISLAYAKRATIWSDLKIVAATIASIFMDPAAPLPSTSAPSSAKPHELSEEHGNAQAS